MKLLRQAVAYTDEKGRECRLDVIDRFEHRGVEYALLIDLAGGEEVSTEKEIFVMRILYDGEYEQYVPLTASAQEEIMPIVWVRLTGIEALKNGIDTSRLS